MVVMAMYNINIESIIALEALEDRAGKPSP
jgi:hypothetical protein